jgi:hypothetical protein
VLVQKLNMKIKLNNIIFIWRNKELFRAVFVSKFFAWGAAIVRTQAGSFNKTGKNFSV